jgi:hypothetical protein
MCEVNEERLELTELEWHYNTVRYIRKHGGSIRVCREVMEGSPRFVPQQGRRGSHLMIGPDKQGRIWTVAIHYIGDGRAAPVTCWPSNSSQMRWYEERTHEP